jgi:lipopolysaccharide transport system ATP-binding protein
VSYRIRVRELGKEYALGTSLALPQGIRSLLRLAGRPQPSTPVVERTIALADVSFDVEEGERIGIIGENGAGKSTLLHLLAGVAVPTHGAIEIDGRVHAALTIGVALREDLTGRDNLYVDAEIQGRSRADVDAMMDEMVAFAELGAFIDHPVHTYSSGMKARLAFTSLVFVEPEILLIDETLSVGDHWFAQKATRAVRDLCAKGRIVMLVSHSLESIVAMCSRCLWLEAGRLVADGSPVDVTAAYRERLRQRDEAEMAAKFALSDVGWARDEAARITHVTVGSSRQTGSATIVGVGESVWVRIGVRVTAARPEQDVRLWIERLDGLRVTDNRWSDSGVRPTLAGEVEVVAEMDPLLLGPGLYRVQAELFSRTTVLATAGTVFKVVADRALRGGQPALRAPITVACHPSSPSE